MSLLLDALKKAASEKEKVKSSQADETIKNDDNDRKIIDSTESDDVDLDLNLDLDDDVCPEVDETLLNIKVSEETNNDSEINDEKVEIEDESAPSVGDRPVETKIVSENKEDVSVENIDKNISDVKVASSEPRRVEPEKIIKTNRGVENKEVLSELINKSNKYSRKRQMRTKIILVSGVISFLVLIVAYLYFELNSEIQTIYVVDDSNKINKKRVANKIIKKQPISREVIDKLDSVASSIKTSVPVVDKLETKDAVKKAPKKEIVKKKEIKVTYKTVKDPLESIVLNAYTAFQKGDYASSESLYKQVIIKDQKNRDALLGLAAIAVKQGRYEYARQKYLQLRYLNPKDSIAIAGLSFIQNKIETELGESELKFMLREQPDAGHLYFALGTIYSQKKNWAEAQAAYFSAYSSDSDNADYVYNLAVSLDRLGKRGLAKQYYEKSIGLSSNGKGEFSVEVVKKRLSVLSKK